MTNEGKGQVELKDKKEEYTKGKNEEYEVVEFEVKPERIVCPDCGGITLEGLDFCHKCGGELNIFELNEK